MTERRIFLNTEEPTEEDTRLAVEDYTTELIKADIASCDDGNMSYFIVTIRGAHPGAFDFEAFKDELAEEFDLRLTIAEDRLLANA